MSMCRDRSQQQMSSRAVARRLERLHRVHVAYRNRQQRLQEENNSLCNKCNELEHELQGTQYRLGRIYSEVEEELEAAQRIQEGLLPKELPEMVNLKSAAIYIPAGKVGGDLYDIIITPRQKIAILIFDVSGHGIPAALIGAMAKMLFAHYLEKTDSPAEVFRHVNKQLCSSIKTEQYLTSFLGIIDPVNNTMTYSRAGHVAPLVYHAYDQSISRLDSKGFFIGHSALLDIAEYANDIVPLETGDKVLFFTDGLTEGYNPDGVLYGGERLKNIFTRCGSSDVQEIVDTVVLDQEHFRAGSPLRDDFTMLCVEIGDSEQLLAESGFTREEEPSILVAFELDDVDRTCSIILRAMDLHGYSDRSIKQFKVCVFEMMTNAIMHGNQGDQKKKVMVFYTVTQYAVTISVVDEGHGYDYNAVPNPLLPEQRMRDHGRGLFLVKHYLDEVSFNTSGNRILGRKYQEQR